MTRFCLKFRSKVVLNDLTAIAHSNTYLFRAEHSFESGFLLCTHADDGLLDSVDEQDSLMYVLVALRAVGIA